MFDNHLLKPSVLYAKQPLFNRERQVIGYELLFRPQQSSLVVDGNKATAQVMLNIFTSDDPILENEDLAIYVNFTADWILQGVPIDRKNCVVEVLEDVTVTPELSDAIRELRRQGLKVALDDFNLSLSTSALLPEADVVKIDVLELPRSEIKKTLRALRSQKKVLLAEKVETQEMYDWPLEQGFDLFQGYFFCKPEIRQDKFVKPPKQTTLTLLASLMDNDVDFDDIARQLKSDPVLAVKLLQLVNSSRFNRLRKIKNLDEAVVVLGVEQLKRWVALIAMTDLDTKPHELIRMTLVCAYAMENFARDYEQKGAPSSSNCFFIGFLSKLDAYFDRPIDEVVGNLPLDKAIIDAIVDRQGPGGYLLDIVDHLLMGNWDALEQKRCDVPISDFFKTFLLSEQEADDVYQSLISS